MRHRLKKIADLFRSTIEVQYKYHLTKSDVEDIYKFVRTYTKNMSGVGKVFLITVKLHLELYRELKSTVPQ